MQYGTNNGQGMLNRKESLAVSNSKAFLQKTHLFNVPATFNITVK
jgi:hypothetical protein